MLIFTSIIFIICILTKLVYTRVVNQITPECREVDFMLFIDLAVSLRMAIMLIMNAERKQENRRTAKEKKI